MLPGLFMLQPFKFIEKLGVTVHHENLLVVISFLVVFINISLGISIYSHKNRILEWRED